MGAFGDKEQLVKLQRQLVVTALIAFLIYIVFQACFFFADLLRILAISFLLSYLVINVVDLLDRFLNNRALSVALVYVLGLGLAILSAFFVIPAMVYQVASLINTTMDRLPDFFKMAISAMQPLQEKFHQNQIDIKVIDVFTNFAAQLPKPDPGAVVTRVTDMAMSTMTWVVYSISVSVVTFYFLLDGHRMKDAVIGLLPVRFHEKLNQIAHEIDSSLQSFFKGQLVLGLLFGFVMLIVYAVLGVQYSLLLSVFLGLCEILPVIGPPIGFAPAAVAVAIHGTSLPGERLIHIVVLTAIFMILQQVKDNVVAPRYIGNVIGLHPVMIFMAIMIGARIDGMLGIILSLPAACVVNVLFNHLSIGSKTLKLPAEPVLAVDVAPDIDATKCDGTKSDPPTQL